MDRGQSTYLRGLYGFFSSHFDRIMDVLYGGRDEAWRNAGLAELRDSGTVLEVGAGTGRTSSCGPGSDTFLSLDIARAMLGSSSTIDNPVQGDVHTLPFADDSMDAAIAVLLFSTRINQQRALAELDRVVKPRGNIVLVDKFGSRTGAGTVLDSALNVVTYPIGFDFSVDISTLAEDTERTITKREPAPRNMKMIELVVLR